MLAVLFVCCICAVYSFKRIVWQGTPVTLSVSPNSFSVKSIGASSRKTSSLFFRVAENDRGAPLISPSGTIIETAKKDKKQQKPVAKVVPVKKVDKKVEEEVKDEEEETNTDVDPRARKLALLKGLSKGIIPVAASVGFAVTPSSNVAVRVVGAAAGGVAGYIAKARIDSLLQLVEENEAEDVEDWLDSERFGVSKDVLIAVRSLKGKRGILKSTSSSLEAVARKHRVREEDLSVFFTLVLCDVLHTETLSPDSMNLIELGRVVDFIADVGFTRSEIGDAFAMAALRIGRRLNKDPSGFFEADYPVDRMVQAAKMFFLADKLLGKAEGFYSRRINTTLQAYFTAEQYRAIITDACEELFATCVNAVLLSSRWTRREFQELQSFLTASPEVSDLQPNNMQNSILQAIIYTLDSDLVTSRMQIKQAIANDEAPQIDGLETLPRYEHAQQIFGWSPLEMRRALEQRTLPLFEKSARQVFRLVHDNPDQAEALAGNLQQTQQALYIDIHKATPIFQQIIREYNAEYLERVANVYKASGNSTRAAFKTMTNYARTIIGFQHLVKAVVSDSDAQIIPIPGLPLAEIVREFIYELREQRRKQASLDGKEEDEEEAMLEDMFGMTQEQKLRVQQFLALPQVLSWIQTCIAQNNFSPFAQQAYRKQLRSLNITARMWLATAVDLYHQEVQKVAGARAIPSAEDIARLAELRTFLGLHIQEDAETKKHVQAVHYLSWGEKYIKAVTEAMTPTGIIAPEYVDGLRRLRDRLGLSEDDAKVLAAVVAYRQVSPLVHSLMDIYKSNTDMDYRTEKKKTEAEEKKPARMQQMQRRAQRAEMQAAGGTGVFGFMDVTDQDNDETDDGEANPRVFMREAVNLVDMVVDNLAVHGVSLTEENAARVPINALSILKNSRNSTWDLAGMFQYYVFSRLTETDATLRERYVTAEPIFAQILGLSTEAVDKLKQGLAYRAFKSLLRRQLLQKPRIEAQDIQQFAILKEQLPLEDVDEDEDEEEEEVEKKEETKMTKQTDKKTAQQTKSKKQKRKSPDLIFDQAVSDSLLEHAYLLFAKRTPSDEKVGRTPVDKLFAATNTKYGVPPELLAKKLEASDVSRFREQVESLGRDIREIGLNNQSLLLFFALEVQACIESGREDELATLPQVYGFSEETAVSIVDFAVRRYLSQLVALALYYAKKYDEKNTVERTREIVKFAPYCSETAKIAADATMFKEADIDRLVAFYLADHESQVNQAQRALKHAKQTAATAVSAGGDESAVAEAQAAVAQAEAALHRIQAEDVHEQTHRLRNLIFITTDYKRPQYGIDGLLGKAKTYEDIQREAEAKGIQWSWG